MPTFEINGEVIFDWNYVDLEVTDSDGTVTFETKEEMNEYIKNKKDEYE
ncbi:MAG: hypothetical protein V7739_17830 [Motiliproteus sp.]